MRRQVPTYILSWNSVVCQETPDLFHNRWLIAILPGNRCVRGVGAVNYTLDAILEAVASSFCNLSAARRSVLVSIGGDWKWCDSQLVQFDSNAVGALLYWVATARLCGPCGLCGALRMQQRMRLTNYYAKVRICHQCLAARAGLDMGMMYTNLSWPAR